MNTNTELLEALKTAWDAAHAAGLIAGDYWTTQYLMMEAEALDGVSITESEAKSILDELRNGFEYFDRDNVHAEIESIIKSRADAEA